METKIMRVVQQSEAFAVQSHLTSSLRTPKIFIKDSATKSSI